MQHIVATQNMGLLVMVTLLLIVGGGGKHVSFVDAAMTTLKTETRITYWAAVLPGVPVPPAIIDLLAQQNGLGYVDGITMSPNNLKFVNGLRKIGPKYEKAAKSKSDHGDKHVHIASKDEYDLKEISMSYGSQAHRLKIEGNLKEMSVSYGSAEGKDGHNEVLDQGEEDPNKATMSYGSEEEEDPNKVTMSYGSEQEDDRHKASYKSEEEEDPNKATMSYGSKHEDDPHKATMSYKSEEEEDPNKATMSYGSEQEEDTNKATISYRSEEEEEPNKATMSYGSEHEDDPHRATMSYGSEEEEDPNKATMSYGSEQEEDTHKLTISYQLEEEEDPNKVTMSYRSEEEEDLNKVTMSYRSEEEEDPNKVTMSYRSEEEEDPNKVTMSYRSEEEEDPNKVTMSYKSEEEEDPNKATMSYRSGEEEDPNKVTMSYGSEHEDDPHKATMSYGSQHEDDKKTVSTGHEAHIAADMGSHHHHVHAHSHSSNKRQQADVFFFQDILRPGSIITPSIRPTTYLPRLLPRRVADSIPFSTGRFSDIVAMFTPTTLRMTREIRWTLDTCEHPWTLPGQNAGCATSLESLAELPASLLGTHNVHAFSAANLPVEAPGTRALRGRYNVTVVRKVSGESSAIVTCHDLTYPYAVYYCHTANPTAAYSVTLASVEDGAGTPATMEALAVCHLDTSKWSPKHPFFELHNLKPGEVTLCHFLTKLSIIWVPGGEQGEARYK